MSRRCSRRGIIILAALFLQHANHAACFAVPSNKLGQDLPTQKSRVFPARQTVKGADKFKIPTLNVFSTATASIDPVAEAIRRARSRFVPSNGTTTTITIVGGAQEVKVAKATIPTKDASVSKVKDVTAVEESETKVPLSNIDVGTFWIHFCAAVTMTLPVMIVPMMDSELAAMNIAAVRGASLAALMASMAPLGNGIGKLVNGMVCQQMGGSLSSRVYFIGSILASSALACLSLTGSGLLTTGNLGWMVGGIEFFASIQWTVCSLFLSQYYRKSPALFARGVTILALSSTGGQIIAKVAAACLLQFFHWRHVARISVLTAAAGLMTSLWTSRNMARALGSMSKKDHENNPQQKALEQEDQTLLLEQQDDNASAADNAGEKTSAKDAALKVLGNPVFWGIGLAHISGYLTRTSDRVMGIFLQEITSLSRKYPLAEPSPWQQTLVVTNRYFATYLLILEAQICGGLTAFMTVGFLYGLVTTSRKFHQPAATKSQQLTLLRNGYFRYLLAALGLVASAAFGKHWHPWASASLITLCASIMASSIAFPFFQVPNMVSSVYFGPVKPVALSLIDGTGIFMTSPIWKVFNKLLLPTFGWSASWSAVAVIVGLCGTLLMKTMPKVLDMQQQQQQLQEQEKVSSQQAAATP